MFFYFSSLGKDRDKNNLCLSVLGLELLYTIVLQTGIVHNSILFCRILSLNVLINLIKRKQGQEIQRIKGRVIKPKKTKQKSD